MSPSAESNRKRPDFATLTKAITAMLGSSGGGSASETEDTKRPARRSDNDDSSTGSNSSASELRSGAKSKERRHAVTRPSTTKKQKTGNEGRHYDRLTDGGSPEKSSTGIVHGNRIDRVNLMRREHDERGSPLRLAASSTEASRHDPITNMRMGGSPRRFEGAISRVDDIQRGLRTGKSQLHNLNEALSLQQRLEQERLFQEHLLSSRSPHHGLLQQRHESLLPQDDHIARQEQLLHARGILQRQQDLDDLEALVRRRIDAARPSLAPEDDITQRFGRLQRSGLMTDRALQQDRPQLSLEQQRLALEQHLLGRRQTDPARESSQLLELLAARRSSDYPFNDLPSTSAAAASALRGRSPISDQGLIGLDSSRLYDSNRSEPLARLPAASSPSSMNPRYLTSDLLLLERQRLLSSRRMDERGVGIGSDALAFRDRLLPTQHSGGSILGRGFGEDTVARAHGVSARDIPRHATLHGELPAVLARPDDKQKLSPHQVFLRHQIEAFQATADDVTTHTRGRNKPIRLKQVGIRCRHCAHLPVSHRQKGSTYFPATLMGFYQAAQNMGTTHLQCGLCHAMPPEYKDEFARLLSTKSSSSGAGRPFWADSARELGLVDTNQGIYLRGDMPEGVEIMEPDRVEYA